MSAAAPALIEEGERFAAYVAHELRTPLATQRSLLELALSDPNMDAVMWREIGADILGACTQQERLLEACLTLARSRDRRQLREPVDLAAIARDSLRAQDRQSLTAVVGLEPAWTSGDQSLVERLVANLVSNAIRHNVPNGRIEVATRTGSGRAVLSVVNTGPLVPPAEIPRLFQPFQRLNSQAGVGLGLAIVQAIANAHDATVSARVRKGGGLGIDVAFPALD
jgi:signal transduction histidine kinase